MCIVPCSVLRSPNNYHIELDMILTPDDTLASVSVITVITGSTGDLVPGQLELAGYQCCIVISIVSSPHLY